MLLSVPSEAENHGENAAFTPEIPQETPAPLTIEREATKQFSLRPPISVIADIENVVKTRRLHGEMIETPMYCRYILENHRKVSNYDADMEKLRRENAALTSRILELQLCDENDALTDSTPSKPSEHDRVVKALQAAIKKATETFAKDGFYTAEYYETIVSDYYRQILPQIPA